MSFILIRFNFIKYRKKAIGICQVRDEKQTSALRQFFDSAKKTKWYNNTLFILTADHGSLSKNSFYNNPVGNLTIPILFFKPDNSLKKQISLK